MTTDGHVVAGYLAVRPVARPEWPGLSTMPAQIISLTTEIAPVAPIVAWYGGARELLERFGVAETELDVALDWLTARDEDLGFPDVSYTPEIAAEFVRRFAPHSGARLLGYGLPVDAVDDFFAARETDQPDGIVEMLARREPFAPGARVLGYEPCSADLGGLTNSWLIHGFPDEVASATGTRVNREGFVDASDMRAVDAYIDGIAGKEPGWWRSWLVVEYPTSI